MQVCMNTCSIHFNIEIFTTTHQGVCQHEKMRCAKCVCVCVYVCVLWGGGGVEMFTYQGFCQFP